VEENEISASSLEKALKDVRERGMFTVSHELIAKGIRSNYFSRQDIYEAHKDFVERKGWGHEKLKMISWESTREENHKLEYLAKLRKKVGKGGRNSLTFQDVIDLKWFQNRGLVNIHKEEKKYRQFVALRDYGSITKKGIARVSADNLAYGINNGLFSERDVNEKQNKHFLAMSYVYIYNFGLSGLSKEQEEVVEYCINLGLLTEKGAKEMNMNRKMVDLRQYRKEKSE